MMQLSSTRYRVVDGINWVDAATMWFFLEDRSASPAALVAGELKSQEASLVGSETILSYHPLAQSW